MASENILKKLLEEAKKSTSFAGMKEEDIWQACQAYADRPDEDIEVAISKIKMRDLQVQKDEIEKHHVADLKKAEQVKMHQEEEQERSQEIRKADDLLKELFNKNI